MSRKPDFRVGTLNKLSGSKANIGAAWKNEDGTISVVLDSSVRLEQKGNLLIILFPIITKKF